MEGKEGDKEKSAKFKEEGNKLFAANKFQKACDAYSKAIEANPTNAVFYANRAFCHIKLEAYGSAIEDASKAVELDPTYIKGYYRRGAAYLAMGKYSKALIDIKEVIKIAPKDKDAKVKLDLCRKAIREQKFAEAIESEHGKPMSETAAADWKAMDVPSTYDGPRLDSEDGPESVTLEFVKAMMERFRNQKLLHKKYVYKIVLDVITLFKTLPNLVEIDIPKNEHFTVCGDVHGQFFDVLNIFELNGLPDLDNPYLFNGDFVDRGSFSYEVILTFFAFKLLYPKQFFMTRGNHESRTMNSMYGFKGEIVHKADDTAYELFCEAFNLLPLGAILSKKVLVVHGGLFSQDNVTIDQIQKIDRNCQPPDTGLMCEMLWSDPQPQKGRAPSKRGVALSFGPDVTAKFLKDNQLDLLVRSHEVKDDGYEVDHDGKCITVFSAPNYCDAMGNKGAFVKFKSDLKPIFKTYAAAPHPAVKPMAYASSMFGMG